MKSYCFEGLLTIGTGKFNFYSNWDEDNHLDFPACRPDDFPGVHFDSQEHLVKGLYKIFVEDCPSLTAACKLLKNVLFEQQLNFYSGCRYTCTSFGSSKITRSVRYFRDNFEPDSV